MSYTTPNNRAVHHPIRSIAIPPMPPNLTAPGYTPFALAARERFLRAAAAAWARAGDTETACRLNHAADVQGRRFGSNG